VSNVDEHLLERLGRACALAKLVGQSPAFLKATAAVPLFADSDAAVLISGETGAGKELLARAIHYLSPRAALPFVAVNCGALPDSLLENELFGHERGAFTDAQATREGLLAEAGRGTLFLDEIEALSPRAQVVLLRVLQDGSFRPLGSTRAERRAEARFVAATNTPLELEVQAGRFRADLYYRIGVLCVSVPPLRERPEDIVPLARHFLRKHAGAEAALELSASAEAALLAHRWPGNVRELENVILRAALLRRDGRLEAPDLGLRAAPAAAKPAGGSFNDLKRQAIDAFERDYLTRLMLEHSGNVSRAARAAGKERRDLGRLLKKHRLDSLSARSRHHA
jgi:DNA-binding NtrC family response regulator